MQLSRRALLSVLPASALFTAAQSARARAVGAGAARATGRDVSGDHARLVANTVAALAGTADSNSRTEVAPRLTAVRETARARLAAMDAAPTGALFKGLPLGESDTNLTTSFQYLYEIALATVTPGPAQTPAPAPSAKPTGGAPQTGSADHKADHQTDHQADRKVDHQADRKRVIDGLARLYDDYYGDQSKGYYGNWFNWEIGISSHITRILVLLKDDLAAYRPELTATCVASMDAYLRNGKGGDVDLDSRFHTGANLADITTNRMLQGAVLNDEARVTKALADQLTVLARIDPYHLDHQVTDGFYADGSYLQHGSVAYTGSYGKGLLTRVVQTVKILEGTAYVRDDSMVVAVRDWVRDGFAPLIFEGWMMEIVKGRGVSRTVTGYADTAAVVEAVVDLSGYAAGDEAAALKGYVRFVRQTSHGSLSADSFTSPVSIARYADIVADASLPASDLRAPAYTAAFNAMDRTVHRRPGWAFALARSSSRVSAYEYMSGENLMPWFQGAGAHYLYLAGQDQSLSYGVDYYTVLAPSRLAGVTAPVETRRTVPELYGTQWYDNPEAGFTSSSESQNAFVYFPRGTNSVSGGAVLGSYGAAALVQADDAAYAAKQAGALPDDFVAYQGARATKSWFMLDDEVVVLAAGIRDPAGRAVTTTLDSRIADPSDDVSVHGEPRRGGSLPGDGTAHPVWLRYVNATRSTAVGYVFLKATAGVRPTVTLETVTRGRRLVRQANPDTSVTKQVFSVQVEQPPSSPSVAMAYALVPNASARRLRGYAHGPLKVLANTVGVQAVVHAGLGLTAANTFTRGSHRAGRLSMEGPASVILRRSPDGTTTVAVSDPTMERNTVSVTVLGPALRVRSADAGVRVRRVSGGTRLDVTTHHAYGRSFTAVLDDRSGAGAGPATGPVSPAAP
ncbi:polysaccharide lyase family 8 super-sandwich domain-containing protein [Streptomyces tsukubensis]|uniref:Silent information regulator protein Sir2 n=1 Tax=Streptomyces tsukubensis TaxID=83656 RepID=A0A1V3ZZS6_9ACTN|nr:polysaccharide lyase family 8 super-sandwich domain-containing protein [Streptomyces tsukubensis]OON71464.1 silent information regulator protein Sir2 [Streptomyces tsukubensis]QFR97001.1 silent information regulator protein Sir2 [Streptomyces tsukubensis]